MPSPPCSTMPRTSRSDSICRRGFRLPEASPSPSKAERRCSKRDDMRTAAARSIRITHRSSGEVIAEGPLGFWGITPFEGNLYISRKCLKTGYLRPNWVPGLCIYKFLYVWLDLRLPNGAREPFVGWMYWLPNPLLPFIAFRPAGPRSLPVLQV